MLIWCAMLFVLGILAFLDSVFNMGEIFRQINSVLFMLLSLALLIRVSTKARERLTERYKEQITNLEREVTRLKEAEKKLAEY